VVTERADCYYCYWCVSWVYC